MSARVRETSGRAFVCVEDRLSIKVASESLCLRYGARLGLETYTRGLGWNALLITFQACIKGKNARDVCRVRV